MVVGPGSPTRRAIASSYGSPRENERVLLNEMNPISGNRPIARKLAMAATVLGLWGTLVLLFAAPLALIGPVSWREAVSFGGSFWVLWLLFLPVVAWLSFRFPIERRRLLRNIGLHL